MASSKKVKDPRDFLCCGRFRIKTASYVVLGVEAVIIVIAIIYSAVTLARKPHELNLCGSVDEHVAEEHQDNTKIHCNNLRADQEAYDDVKFILYAVISICIIQTIVIIVLILGILFNNEKLVLPHFVVQILLILFLIFFSIFLGVHGQKIFLVVIAVLICIVQCWSLYVIWCLFSKIKSKKQGNKTPTTTQDAEKPKEESKKDHAPAPPVPASSEGDGIPLQDLNTDSHVIEREATT